MSSEQIYESMRAVFHESPFLDHVGAKLGALGEGTAEISLELQPALTNRRGVAHGGVLATLMDSALSQAIRTMVPPETASATVEMKMNFMAPGSGRLTARGRALQVGGAIAMAQAEIYDAQNTLVAVGIGTFRLFRSQTKAKD